MQGGIEITRAGAADDQALSLIGATTFLETYADLLPGEDIVTHCRTLHGADYYRDWLSDDSRLAWIARNASGAPVGYLTAGPPDLPVDTRSADLEINRIYVLATLKGQGLGRRLLDSAAEAARELEVTRLVLGVFGRNQAAQAFYARLGFRQIGVRQFQVGASLHDDLVLGLDLT
ncbi:MAG: GNAT family N-acetyltransferase [Caulobacteraceae bacterium]|nr:GNAT family N-acetyltransferase [Caulobacteraceae bacterium]